MNIKFKRQKMPGQILLSSLGVVMSLTAMGQNTTLEQIKTIELNALEQGVNTQEKIAALDDERLILANEYRNTLKNLTNVNTYNEQLDRTIARQEQEMELVNEQIQRIGSLEQDIVPLMLEMVDALETFIALDVPFLQSERQKRVNNIRQLMNDPQLSNSEKYRRILEAYQIENDYGRTIEAYDGKLNDDDNEPIVTFIKIGRVAYFYQTLDGEQTFRWSNALKDWQRLDSKDNAAVQTAIAMAKERIPSNLLVVPVELPLNLNLSMRGQ